ncbi:MAG: UvrD-helicase domain-containing protein [Aeriscardovia sp.]|nr:UvrD-helicase domain-containing protein [Aeriscardovia sp.]
MSKTIEEILEGLNPEQKEAVTYPGKYLLVSAGAGSGKTRVLTRRIAYELLKGEAGPSSFIAITFTNKAAREMKERLEALVGPRAAYGMQISTFHSACSRLLRRHPDPVGLEKNFAIYDEDAKMKVLNRIISKMDFAADPAKACKEQKRLISKYKNNGISWEAAFKDLSLNFEARYFQKMPWDERNALVYRDYERDLAQNNAVDFDDLISKAIELLKKDGQVRGALQKRFTRIFVDEYQDTNPAQYKLIRLLASPQAFVTAVGDSDQSIYAFRGSDISIIGSFTKDFEGSKSILLEQNYRSTPNILSVANSVIKHNPKRVDKKLWTKNGEGKKVELVECETEMEEARFISSTIESLHSKGEAYSSFAVLYRNNDLSEPIEKRLAAKGVPYQIKGGRKFYDRKEVKDAVAYLSAVVNPKDDVGLLRIINTPARGIGKVSQEKLEAYASEKGIHLQAALKEAGKALRPGVAKACLELGEKLDGWRLLASSAPLGRLVRSVVARSGLLEEKAEGEEGRSDNLFQLCSAAEEMESQNPSASLIDFLEQVSLMQDGGEEGGKKDLVSLMTIHSAKGLEFPIVFVAGMEEGIFPSLNARPKDEEEDRRLAYVAITRAQRELFLLFANERYRFGERKRQKRSRFLDEISPDLLSQREVGARPLFGFERPSKGKAGFDSYRSAFREKTSYETQEGHGKGAQFLPGSCVIHKTMGLGTVEEVFPTPTGKRVKINFRGYGSISFPASDKSIELLD